MVLVGEEAAESTLDEQFVAIVCADKDLLQAEFDAIVASAWWRPPLVRRPLGAAPPPGGGGRHATGDHRPVVRADQPAIGSRARQRSPPVALRAW